MKTVITGLVLLLLVAACVTPEPKPAAHELAPPASASQPIATAEPDNGMAPRTVVGSQLHYRDLHGNYIYTFFADGRYRFISVSQNKTDASSREGHYRYTLLEPGKTILTFDDAPAIRLAFSDPLTMATCAFTSFISCAPMASSLQITHSDAA